MRDLALFALLFAGCSSSNGTESVDAPKSIDAAAGSDAAHGSDATPGSDAAPQIVTVDLGEAGNDLHWMPNTMALYLDSYTNTTNVGRLRKYTDAGGLVDVATVQGPAAGMSFQLAGVTPVMGGSFVVMSFFSGVAYTVNGDVSGAAFTAVSGLANAKRIGVASAMGKTYDVSFVGGGGGAVTGTVNQLAIDGANAGTETAIATAHDGGTAFGKLVGVAVQGTNVFVTEQVKVGTTSAIYKIDTANANAVTTIASALPCADLLAVLPDGDLLTSTSGCMNGANASPNDIARISQTGTVTMLGLTGLDAINGIAYDAAGKRLFVIDHPVTGSDSLKIIPYDAQ
jgi:hypothetical protein